MKKYILVSLLVLTSLFVSVSCTARSFDFPPIKYTVETIHFTQGSVSNVLKVLKTSNSNSNFIEEEPQKRNSFWKFFALAITVLLVVLFL